MLFFRRYLAALAVLAAAYGVYASVVAPWAEPPPMKRPHAAAPLAPVQVSDQTRYDLERLFPPGAWERDTTKVKVIETEHATLLIEHYEPTLDGQLKLNPCTVIFYAEDSGGPADGGARAAAADRRPFVMQAPQGAVLAFNQPLDLARATFGRVEKGRLVGPVTIYSPPTLPDGDDDFHLATSDIWLDRESVYTSQEVEFRLGRSFGRGRDLRIVLASQRQGARGRAKLFRGVQSITLERLDRLHIAGEGANLFAAAAGGQHSPDRSGPMEITCRGGLAFDVMTRVARLERQVEVVRLNPAGPPDRLHHCDELLLAFTPRRETPQAPGKKSANQKAPPPADAPAGHSPQAAGPEVTRLKRIVAVGQPVILEAPTSGVRASAAWMEYSPASNRLSLKPQAESLPGRKVTQVSLSRYDQHLIARELQYEAVETSKLGRVIAAGPGEVRLIQGRGAAPQPVVARWEKRLLVRPDQNDQVISLEGSASIVAEPLGRFDADELHLWVSETLLSSPPPDSSIAGRQKSQPPRRTAILPARLLAIGKQVGDVRLTAPQLEAHTARLEAWFIHLPAGESPPGQPAPGTPGVVREPVQPAAFASSDPPPAATGGAIRPPNLQKFQVRGDKIQLQLEVQGRKFDMRDLTIQGRATIDETRTSEPGQEPIHLAGDKLELRSGTTPEAVVQASGHPAEIAGRGLALSGGQINVHLGANRLWIDGPGEASLRPAASGSFWWAGSGDPRPTVASDGSLGARFADPPPTVMTRAQPSDKIHLQWQHSLTFDGQTASFAGEVRVRTTAQLAICQTLEATLSERINFAGSQRGGQPEVSRLHLDGGVFMQNQSLDEQGLQISLDQMRVPNFTVDRAAGTLYADGPGWVSTVRRGAAGLPGLGADAAARPLGPPQETGQSPLTSVHVAFERAIVGSIPKREIQFQHDVRTTYCPADEFTDLLVAREGEPLANLGPRAVLMTSDKLTLREMPGPPPWIEIQATENVVACGSSFTIKAASVGYDGNKELLTVSGDGRMDAELWYQPQPGARPSPARARKFMYWLRTGQYSGEGFTSVDFVPSAPISLPPAGP